MRLFRSPRLILIVAFGAALGTAALIAAERSARSMAGAATAFVNSLTPEQRQKATFPFGADERLRWHFIPTETFPRNGLTLKEMTEPQRKLAYDLLRAALSQRGYLTATAIIDLETLLGEIEGRARGQQAAQGRGGGLVRDAERYFFSVFGTPSATDPWGWRVEGHHVSLHFAVLKGSFVASSPSFLGSNPAEVREEGPKKGLRILGDQEDAARALLMALNESQKSKAIFQAEALNDIVTGNRAEVTPLSPNGLLASEMTVAQRDLLMKTIEVYTGRMADDIASERLEKVRQAGIEKIGFAWAGGAERGQRHYYRIQGPTFLIEHDNSQGNGNHVHSVWRDFNGDFGRDLIREHLTAVQH